MIVTVILAVGTVLGLGGTAFFGYLSLKLRSSLYNLEIEKRPLTITEEKVVYKEIKVAAPPPKLIALHPHDLDSVFWNKNTGSYGNTKVTGWWYKCTCGRQQAALENKNASESTEADAINRWKEHKENYKDLPYSTTEESNHLVEELNEAKRKLATCFCHDLQEPEKRLTV